LPVLPDIHLAVHLRLLNGKPVRKLRTRSFSYPARLDAALCGIKADSTNSHLPPEFEFKVLNANLMAPQPAVVIIIVVRSSFARQKTSTTEELI
jgi:hypothetical protein